MRMKLVLACALAGALTACHRSTTFVSDEGRFSVAMPHAPKHEERTIDPEDPTETHFFTASDGGMVFMVIYADIPTRGRASAEVFDGARDNAMSKPGRKLVSESPVSLGPHPGRDLLIAETRGFLRVRMFLVGSRFYQVAVGGRDDALVKSRSEVFYESFKVL